MCIRDRIDIDEEEILNYIEGKVLKGNNECKMCIRDSVKVIQHLVNM